MFIFYIIMSLLTMAALTLLIWIRKLKEELKFLLKEELRKTPDSIVMKPQNGSFRGADKEFGRVKCAGVMYATDKRLIFHSLFGKHIELSYNDIKALHENKWFLSAYRSGRLHLIFETKDDNRIGFLVHNNEEWKQALMPLISLSASE